MKIKRHYKVIFFIFGTAFVFLAYAYYVEPNTLQTEKINMEFSCASGLKGGIKFAHISDLHFTKDTPDKRLREVSSAVKAQKPTAIFITGDLIADKNGIPKTLAFAEMFSGDIPIYAVFGNWDYWSLDFDVKDFTEKLSRIGVNVLINKNDKIIAGGKTFYIFGVKDPYTSGDNEFDLQKAMSDVDFEEGSCKILLAHSPNIIKYAKGKKMDIILVGHTHGGQVYIPFITNKLIPARREAGKGYVKGLYIVDDDRMYVNRGIGTSLLPLRFLVPPELTIININ